jgi:endonuclease/exonuclease/phosphatase family metal-dependent hydrolase
MPRFLDVSTIALATMLAAGCARGLNYTSPDGPRFAGSSTDAQAPQPDSLRVATFNVKYSDSVEKAITLLENSPELRNASVLFLQEMNEESAAEMAAALHMNYVYYPAQVHPVPARNFGNAILSRWPIVDDQKLILPSRSMTRGAQRIAVAATLLVGDQRVRVYSVHLATLTEVWYTGQTYQAQAVLGDAAKYDKVVIAGDMNSHDVGVLFTRAGYFWPSRNTGPTTHKLFAVDHVFTRGFTIGGSAAVKDNIGASDHLPVWATLAFRPATVAESASVAAGS